MKILITGDSHTGALRRGLAHLKEENRAPEGCDIDVAPLAGGNALADSFFVDEGSHLRVPLPMHPGDGFVLPVPGGNYDWYGLCAPLHSLRVYRDLDWLTFSTREMPPAPVPLSLSAFRRAVRDDQRYVFEFLKALKRIGVKVFVVEPPRPFRHHGRVKRLGAAKLLSVDGAYRAVIREELARIDVPVVGVPASALDDEGFMLAGFRSERDGDQHHGSRGFGALMLEEVARFVKEREQA